MSEVSKILIALPVYNEELVLKKNVATIVDYLKNNFPDNGWQIAIADNASSDKTGDIGRSLANEMTQIKYFFIPQKGRGGALKKVFTEIEADVYIYMDIDLAVDINCLRDLIGAAKNGFDMAIGSRFTRGSKVKRSPLRELSSRIYKGIARLILKSKINDFQCGFKLINRTLRNEVLPLTNDVGFFWDTEIVYLTEIMGYKIKEAPVDWSEFRDKKRKSTVSVLETTIDYLKKIRELRLRGVKFFKNQKQNRGDHDNQADDLR
jgi:glycosyltransferase involved in cell wall biosynthesis